MKMIVGLGNPGVEYENTRHNIGFTFIDNATKNLNLIFKTDKKLKCMICKTNIFNKDVVLVKPLTYMNLSGESVKLVKDYFKIDASDILVIHDDLDLPVGKIRIRSNGSSGGQKGMNNIIELLQTQDIKRIRIGISKGPDIISHVLGKFKKDEQELIDNVMIKAFDMLNDYLNMTFDKFMGKYN